MRGGRVLPPGYGPQSCPEAAGQRAGYGSQRGYASPSYPQQGGYGQGAYGQGGYSQGGYDQSGYYGQQQGGYAQPYGYGQEGSSYPQGYEGEGGY